jgi:hypothetical protein
MTLYKSVETDDYKITVESVENGHNDLWIATFWDKTSELFADRKVMSFETFGGAIDCAFYLLAEANNLFVCHDDIK